MIRKIITVCRWFLNDEKNSIINQIGLMENKQIIGQIKSYQYYLQTKILEIMI